MNLWNFGTVTAAIIDILVTLKLIKAVVDIVIHGYQVHETCGCGVTTIESYRYVGLENSP